MSQNTIKTWQERTGMHRWRPGTEKHAIAEIAELRARVAELETALSRRPAAAAEAAAEQPASLTDAVVIPRELADTLLAALRTAQMFKLSTDLNAAIEQHLRAAGKDSERLEFAEAQIAAAGRALADRSAAACDVDRGDNWKINSEFFIADARAAIDAAMKAGAQGGGK